MLFSTKFKVYTADHPTGILDTKFTDKKGIEYVRIKFNNKYANKEYYVDVPMYRVIKIERADSFIAKSIKRIFRDIPAKAMIVIGRITFLNGFIMLYINNMPIMTTCFIAGGMIWFYGWEKQENQNNEKHKP